MDYLRIKAVWPVVLKYFDIALMPLWSVYNVVRMMTADQGTCIAKGRVSAWRKIFPSQALLEHKIHYRAIIAFDLGVVLQISTEVRWHTLEKVKSVGVFGALGLSRSKN